MTSMASGSDLLRAPEAAVELGLTTREVYELVATGELESWAEPVEGRRGRWVHVSRADVEAYRAAHSDRSEG